MTKAISGPAALESNKRSTNSPPIYIRNGNKVWIKPPGEQKPIACPPLLRVDSQLTPLQSVVAAHASEIAQGINLLACDQEANWTLDYEFDRQRSGFNYSPRHSLRESCTWFIEQDGPVQHPDVSRLVYTDPLFGERIPIYPGTMHFLDLHLAQARAIGLLELEFFLRDGTFSRVQRRRLYFDHIGGPELSDFFHLSAPVKTLPLEAYVRICLSVAGRKGDGSSIPQSILFVTNWTLSVGSTRTISPRIRPPDYSSWSPVSDSILWSAEIDPSISDIHLSLDGGNEWCPLSIWLQSDFDYVDPPKIETSNNGLIIESRDFHGPATLTLGETIIGEVVLSKGDALTVFPPGSFRTGRRIEARLWNANRSKVLARSACEFPPGPTSFPMPLSSKNTLVNIERIENRWDICCFSAHDSVDFGANLARFASEHSAQWFVLKSPDIQFTPEVVEECLDTLRYFPNAQLAGCRMVDSLGRIVFANCVDGSQETFHNPALPEISFAHMRESIDHRFFLVRREHIRSTDLFGASGSADVAKRLVQAAGRLPALFCPTATIELPSSAEFGSKHGGDTGGRLSRGSTFGICLMVDMRPPRPMRDAGSDAAYSEISLLQNLGFHVMFFSVDVQPDHGETRELARRGVEVRGNPYDADLSTLVAQLAPDLKLVYATRHGLIGRVAAAVRAGAPHSVLVLNLADLHSLRLLREASLSPDRDAHSRALLEQAREVEAIREADLVLTYSKEEAVAVYCLSAAAVPVRVLPFSSTAIHVSPSPTRDRRECSFLGSADHPPNIQAIQWFSENVTPLMQAFDPNFRLHVYGSGEFGRAEVEWKESVQFLGHVPLLSDMFDRCRVFVAPLLSGAGVKGKVVSALCNGIPAVLSPIAAEGIGVRDGAECFIASTPREWSAAIRRLQTDDELWRRMSADALKFAQVEFTPLRALAALRSHLVNVGVKCAQLA